MIELRYTNMRDRVCLVTGANTGIGLETTRGLARMGATVLMLCRDRMRAEEARALVRKELPDARLELVIADLSRLSDVRRAAEEVNQRPGPLHVLVNNAAVIPRQRELTSEGLERQWAVNHLAPFLLTNLLLDKLKASAPARVVTVSSQVHAGGQLDFEDLQSERGYEPVKVYNKTKLANVLFALELARRLEGTGVTSNCLHPGVIATNLLSDYMGRARSLKSLLRLTHPSPERGAETSLHLATAPELETVSGKYFRPDTGPSPPSPAGQDRALAQRLWNISEVQCGL